MFFVIIAIILVLYGRTWKYSWNIDDHVPRNEMYTTIPPPPVPLDENGVKFDDKRRSMGAFLTNIGTFIWVCFLVYTLWGFKVALLYAVLPSNVSSTAWGRTGNYYCTTVGLVLTAYYFLLNFQPWGVILAYFLYFGSLHSTVSAVPFIGIALLFPYGWLLIIPLGIFLTGERFTSGLKKRKRGHEKKGIMSARLHWRNLILATNVLAYYILICLNLTQLAFFHTFGRKGSLDTFCGSFWLSLGVVVSFTLFGLTYNPFGLLWFLLFIGVFCNLIPNLGQFVTERYTYIPMIGMCMILCSFFEQTIPELLYVVVGAWFMRSLHYIKAWRSNEALFAHGVSAFPDSPDNYLNLAGWYMDRNQWMRAIQPLECAIRLTVGSKAKLYGNLARCFCVLGENTGIKRYFKNAHDSALVALKDCDIDMIESLQEIMKDMKGREV